MPYIDFTGASGNLEDLDLEHKLEIFATLLGYIHYPDDESRRLSLRAGFLKSLVEKNLDSDSMRLAIHSVLPLPGLLEKHITTRTQAVYMMTSYLCRMITHHLDELPSGASLGKARFLTEEMAKRKGLKGYKDSSLKKVWRQNKSMAPLITAVIHENIRVYRKFTKKYNNGKPKNWTKKQGVEFIELTINKSVYAISQALFIQNQLSKYVPINKFEPILNVEELLVFPKNLSITPRPIKWTPLRPVELENLNNYYSWISRHHR